MRLFEIPRSLLYLLTIVSSSHISTAALLPLPDQQSQPEDHKLVERQNCANPCGFYDQVCCQAGQVCYTDSNNQAQCKAAAQTVNAAPSQGQGSWQYYTTTYVLTDLRTVTTTFSTLFPVSTQNLVPATTVTAKCNFSLGETPCGNNCCSSGQSCQSGQCAAAGGGSSAYFSSFFTVTQIASVPVRPISSTVFTFTSTSSATPTVPFSPPVGTDGSTLIGAQPTTQGHKLSPGAIAGIVIGVIAGIIILLLICLCCCAKGAIDSILGIFGGGKKRRTETTYIEERHSHHGSRPAGRTWFGARPARVDRTEKRRSGGLGGIATVTAGLGALALALGWKRKRERKNEAKSNSSYSYYSDSYTGTSESE
jgi:hypothetical protein